MKKTLIIILVIALIVVLFLVFKNNSYAPEPASLEEQTEDVNGSTMEVPAPGVDPNTVDEMIVVEEETSSQPQSPAEPVVVEVASKAYSFTPSNLQVKVGQPVSLRISAEGFHTFTIDELGVNESTANGTTEIEFVPDRAGVFEFYCAIGNHRQQGQFGTITVVE